MNLLGALAIALSLVAFAITHARLRVLPVKACIVWLAGLALLSVPSLLFAAYYLHVLPEWAWFYSLRSWVGSEFLAVFLGGAAGALAALLPRRWLMLPLFVVMALATVPYIKPLIGPLPDSVFQERTAGDMCLQSTASTCGPASVATILRRLGRSGDERKIAREAFSYEGGTEAWYLARYARARGLSVRFDFRDTFSPEAGLPALVGVRLGGAGHFIAVLEFRGGQITFADPLRGEERLPLAEILRRYQFTGFHMVITAP